MSIKSIFETHFRINVTYACAPLGAETAVHPFWPAWRSLFGASIDSKPVKKSSRKRQTRPLYSTCSATFRVWISTVSRTALEVHRKRPFNTKLFARKLNVCSDCCDDDAVCFDHYCAAARMLVFL